MSAYDAQSIPPNPVNSSQEGRCQIQERVYVKSIHDKEWIPELFQPQTRKLTSDYHNFLLKGLNLRYMYYGLKHVSE